MLEKEQNNWIKLETQSENIFSEYDKHFHHIQHVRNLFKWPGYPGNVYQNAPPQKTENSGLLRMRALTN